MAEAAELSNGPVGYERDGQVAVVTIRNGAVNALGAAVRAALWAAIDRFAEDDAAIAVILGAGRMFVGGADIGEFGKPPQPPSLPDLINHLEASAKPVVAAIHAAALGGGLELALGCHYRIAMPDTRLGLPEVTLGLLPGAGGTQRLPRLTGIAKAAKIMTSGTPVNAAEALAMGFVDRIGEGDARHAGISYARELLAAGAQLRRVSELPGPPPDPEALAALRAELAKTARGLAAPFAILDAVECASRLAFAAGLAAERKLFMALMETPQRAGLIHAFFLERKVSNLPELAGITPRPVAEIGVIGGGTMGAGIATAALLSGYEVTLVERDEASAAKAGAAIAGNLAAAVKRGKLTEESCAAILLDRLACVTDYGRLANADLAIEAVFESMAVKQDVFTKLDAVMKSGAVLATNTSYLDVNEIASATRRPGDVIGLHFFSPAHVMKLLEIAVADATLPDVTATGFALARKLGKIAVRSGVCDGFIGNRILACFRGAADRMVLAGVSPYQLDRAMVDFGFAMGPHAVADLAGLDIGYMTRQRKAATRDRRDVVPGWADDLFHMDRLGQKTGRGYYIYPAGSRSGVEDEEVEALIAKHRARHGVSPRSFTDAEIQRRYMAAMVNEAARVVDEKIAARPLDVDAVLLFGYGFPRHRGGPMHWADSVGLAALLADIKAWAEDDPYFWAPAPLLERLVAERANFASLNA